MGKPELPELGSSERVIQEPWPRQTVLEVPNEEGECWEEGLHSLSCSEDEDRGELVCTGLKSTLLLLNVV